MTRGVIRRAALLAAAALFLDDARATPGAPAYNVQAYIQPSDRVTDTEPIRLVIKIEGTELPEVSLPRFPTLTKLRVVSGPNTSNQLSWVNGRASASSILTYVLLAEKPGPAEVPALQIRIGATSYRTEPIQFEVVRGQTGPRAGPPAPSIHPGERRGEAAGGPDVFLEARLRSEEVWVSQPVSLSVILYSFVEITNFQWRPIPPYSGL